MLDRPIGRLGAPALCCALCALAPREARADEFQDHLDHAGTLAQSERYKDALGELDAAYALRQSPRVLYLMAKMQQRLGAAQAAVASYERYLAADPDADPRLRADAQDQAARLKHLLGKDTPPEPPRGAPVPLGPAEPPPADVHYEMKPSVGLMVGGSVLFGAAYMGAVVTGSIFLEAGSGSCYSYAGSSCPGGNVQTAAGLLLIPVVGPFASAFAYRDPAWSINWSLVDGVAQIGGVVMIAYAATHPRKVPTYGKSFQVLPIAGAGRTGLEAIGRF